MSKLTPQETQVSATPNWQLTAITEALGDLVLTVEDTLSVGRGQDNDVVLGSKAVSRKHAELSVLNGQLYLKDLGSSNGTFVNDKQLEANKSKHVQADDTIQFASFAFRVDSQILAESPVTADVTDDEAEQSEIRQNDASVVEPAVVEDADVTSSPIKGSDTTDNTSMTIKPAESFYQTNADIASSTPDNISDEQAVESSTVSQTVLITDTPSPKPKENDMPNPNEHNRTTTTQLQEEADPEVLRAKQAATSQLSATNDLGADDIGTGHNKAPDQTPAPQQNTVPASSGNMSWLVWVIIAVVVIGIIILLANSLMGA